MPTGPTALSPDAYLEHIVSESHRFRAVLREAAVGTRVPTCPEWDVDDLLWHLAGVQHMWAEVVRTRPATPAEEPGPGRPADRAGLTAFHEDAAARLAAGLSAAAPEEEAWTWHATDHTVGFILRRQAHEAFIHRLDAEIATGTEPAAADPRLAADGVLEALDVMYGGCPPWGTFTPGEELVRVDCTDTGHHVWVRLGRFTGTDPDDGETYDQPDINVVDAPSAGTGDEPDVVVDGPAARLDAWLWHRSDGADLSVAGDRAVMDTFTEILREPLD